MLPPSSSSTVTVIETVNMLAMLRPMIVVSVELGQVYKVALDVDVSMFCAVNVLNAFVSDVKANDCRLCRTWTSI